MAEYIDREKVLDILRARQSLHQEEGDGGCADSLLDMCLAIEDLPEADVVETVKISEQIIRKKAEVSDYWQNDVKRYRAMQGYSDIEHDTDNFLRGYNEAVEDILAIIEGGKTE